MENPKTGKMKHYLKGVTRIDNLAWMFKLASPVLISTSRPITDDGASGLDLKLARAMAKDKQLVTYDAASDSPRVYVRAYYGPRCWDLSINQVPLLQARLALADEQEYHAYFAYLFLEGELYPKTLKPLRKSMSHSPKAVLERGNMTSKVTKLLSLLSASTIDSKAKLEAKWESNPYFLLDAYQLWFDTETSRQAAKSVWPPSS